MAGPFMTVPAMPNHHFSLQQPRFTHTYSPVPFHSSPFMTNHQRKKSSHSPLLSRYINLRILHL